MRKGNSVKRKYVIVIVSVVTALVVVVGGIFAYKQYTLQIDEAKSKEAVNIIAKNMKSDIDKVKTAAEIKTAEAQNKAIKSLNSCINKSNYRSEEKKQVEKIISEYTKKIRKERLGISQTTSGRILKQMVKKGLIMQRGRGKNTYYEKF